MSVTAPFLLAHQLSKHIHAVQPVVASNTAIRNIIDQTDNE